MATTQRRTQAERRAATRAALLDAMLACLVEDGYAGVTTRRVSERAGVSQGALQHHFASKEEFVIEAMRHATDRLAADAMRRMDLDDLHDPARQAAFLDEVWRLHRSPTFKASLELWIAARTDEELRRNLRRLERDVTGMIGQAARRLIPEDEPDLLAHVDLVMATARGYAMLAPVVPQADLDRRWAVAKQQFLAALERLAPA
jgi:AcrR family transcriptional regulator